jgi:hypothetical protein
MDTIITAEPGSRTQNTVALATEFVVVSWWTPKYAEPGSFKGSYDYQTHATLADAQAAHDELERGEYPRARAVCIFASRNGIPIGRVL